MAHKRSNRMKKQSTATSSIGTSIAEKERAKANTYSDAKREQLMGRAMALIYGTNGTHAKAKANQR